MFNGESDEADDVNGKKSVMDGTTFAGMMVIPSV